MNEPSASTSDLTVRGLKTRAVRVKLKFPLGTSVSVLREVPLLLIDLETEEGVVGRTYMFAFTDAATAAASALLHEAVDMIKGQKLAPAVQWKALNRRYALLGVTGLVRMSLSMLDVALWDALAIAKNVPLATMLGAAPRPMRAYDSRALGFDAPEAVADQAETMLTGGLHAVKLRVGYPTLQEDVAAARAVRRRVPAAYPVMCDYNQALTVAEAVARGRALQDEGLYWLEEPIRHDDWHGNAAIARALRIPLQIGENFNGPEEMSEALAHDACDWVMPDIVRIGGVTGWMLAAGIAAGRGMEMSTHLYPEVSCHLLAATPTAHWVEYMDWADAVVAEPLRIENGCVIVPDRPGNGITWDEAKIAKLPAV